MDRYSNPQDKKIYVIEQIKEWARQDVLNEMAKEKARKNKKAAIINGFILTSLLLVLLYFIWMFSKSIGF